MERVDLGISEGYLKHWTVYDALRELYQNAFDRAIESERTGWYNSRSAAYAITKKKVGLNLAIGNYNTQLDKRTLLLGESSKTDNKDTIGKFGEGYKLAVLVLLRNKIKVTVTTGNELWTFKLRTNKQFNVKMLSVDIDTTENSSPDLTFSIIGLPSKLYYSYTQYNLKLQETYDKIVTDNCEVLLDKRNKSKIFVGGLYVCPYDGTSLYGYNFKPGVFPLGRDRNIVSGFDANWKAGSALVHIVIENSEVLKNVLDNRTGEGDTAYLSSFVRYGDRLSSAMWDRFIEEYPDSIPVQSYMLKSFNKEYVGAKAIVVDLKVFEILKKSTQYTEAIEQLKKRTPSMKPEEYVRKFYEEHSNNLDEYFGELMAESLNWKLED